MPEKSDVIKNLKESEERNKAIFELSPEAIVFLDTKGKLLDVNERLYDWLGYKPEEIVGKNVLRMPFLPKESKAKIMEKFAQRMLGREVPPYDVDFSIKNGGKCIGRIIGTPIRDEGGKIIGDLVMISDITERKKIEEKLREKMDELERFNKIMIGRELKMMELKRRIEELEGKG